MYGIVETRNYVNSGVPGGSTCITEYVEKLLHDHVERKDGWCEEQDDLVESPALYLLFYLVGWRRVR